MVFSMRNNAQQFIRERADIQRHLLKIWIYSKKTQNAFRKATVIGDISNNDYYGELTQGATVKIIKEPEITVKAYERGTTVAAQDLDDEDFSLTIDKANYFAFH